MSDQIKAIEKEQSEPSVKWPKKRNKNNTVEKQLLHKGCMLTMVEESRRSVHTYGINRFGKCHWCGDKE